MPDLAHSGPGRPACPACGTPLSAELAYCPGCGQRSAPPASDTAALLPAAPPASPSVAPEGSAALGRALRLLQVLAAASLLFGLIAVAWFLAQRSAAGPPDSQPQGRDAPAPDSASPAAIQEWVDGQARELGALIDGQLAGVPQEQPQALLRWAERYGLLTAGGLVDRERATAYASGFNDVARLKALLALQPDLDGLGAEGTPLCMAAANGGREALWMLLAAGADPGIAGPDGNTPLCLAAQKGYGDCVLLLAANGAEVNAPGADEKTPLALACASASADTVLLLLDCGADPLSRDVDGNTPLHSAAAAGAGSVIGPLCQSGADVNATANDGATALHRAAKSGSTDCIAALLAAGADREMRDAEGRTAQDIARENDMLDAEMALGAE